MCIISSMTSKNDQKLQLLMREVRPGMVLTLNWLKHREISSKLAWWYVKSGWLERIAGGGAYKKVGDEVTWMGAVSALQYQLGLPIYVGGKTALQLLGKAHYVPVAGLKQVVLYRTKHCNISRWFKNTDWHVDLQIRTAKLFTGDQTDMLAILEKKFGNIELKLSAPERAIMEVLYHVPKYNTFHEAELLMEGLMQLRPNVMLKLLQNCSSIKTKRLLLYFAEKYDHPWLKDSDLTSVELGTGKIRIGDGGKYISKYKISIPRAVEDENEF